LSRTIDENARQRFFDGDRRVRTVGVVQWEINLSRLGAELICIIYDDTTHEVAPRLGNAIQEKATSRSDGRAEIGKRISSDQQRSFSIHGRTNQSIGSYFAY
jgi:hypothetical protein